VETSGFEIGHDAEVTRRATINLAVLDQLSARELLRQSLESHHLKELGDDELDDVIRIVGPNPMCLRLAGRLLREEGVAKLRESRSEVLARLKAEKIQALLYGRILRHLHEAEAVASHSANSLLQLRVKATRIRLHRQLHADDSRERAVLRSEARSVLTGELLNKLREYPVLLREVAAELSKDDPRLASVAFESLGVEVASDAQAQGFGRAVATLTRTQTPGTTDSVLAQGVERIQKAHFDAGEIRAWAVENLTNRDTRGLARTLATLEPGSEALGDFREYFRAGVSGSLHDWARSQSIGGVREKIVTVDSLQRGTGESLDPDSSDIQNADGGAVIECFNAVVERLREQTADTGSDVLVAVPDRDVSRLQSELARRAEPDKQLTTGGRSVKFGPGFRPLRLVRLVANCVYHGRSPSGIPDSASDHDDTGPHSRCRPGRDGRQLGYGAVRRAENRTADCQNRRL
jgi:DNA-binding transcriptional ArsR family regulator